MITNLIQRWSVLLLVMICIFVALGLWWSERDSMPQPVAGSPDIQISPDIPTPIEMPVASESTNVVPPSQTSRDSGQALAWQEVAYDSADGLPDRRQKYPAARLVKVDLARWRGLEAGDRIDLQIPQLDVEHAIWINTVERTTAGIVTLTGAVDSNNMLGFVMTLGQGTLFATIWTEQGSFNLDGRGDFAWIIADSDLRAHIDYSKSDTL